MFKKALELYPNYLIVKQELDKLYKELDNNIENQKPREN